MIRQGGRAAGRDTTRAPTSWPRAAAFGSKGFAETIKTTTIPGYASWLRACYNEGWSTESSSLGQKHTAMINTYRNSDATPRASIGCPTILSHGTVYQELRATVEPATRLMHVVAFDIPFDVFSRSNERVPDYSDA